MCARCVCMNLYSHFSRITFWIRKLVSHSSPLSVSFSLHAFVFGSPKCLSVNSECVYCFLEHAWIQCCLFCFPFVSVFFSLLSAIRPLVPQIAVYTVIFDSGANSFMMCVWMWVYTVLCTNQLIAIYPIKNIFTNICVIFKNVNRWAPH